MARPPNDMLLRSNMALLDVERDQRIAEFARELELRIDQCIADADFTYTAVSSVQFDVTLRFELTGRLGGFTLRDLSKALDIVMKRYRDSGWGIVEIQEQRDVIRVRLTAR